MVSKRALLSQIRAGQNVIGCLAGARNLSSVSLFQLLLHLLRGYNQRRRRRRRAAAGESELRFF